MTHSRGTPGPSRNSLVLPPGAFRLVLAAAVVISHLSRFDIGRLAVLMFFFLSGYWTARIWTEKFDGKKLWSFYAARYLRIAPLFILCSVGAALLLQRALHLVNFTLLGVGSTDSDPTGVSWSLDVELQFYLLLPFIVLALSRLGAWPIVFGSALLSLAGIWLQDSLGITTAAKYLPAFLLGVLTFSKVWKPSSRAANVSLIAFAAMTALTAATPFLDKRTQHPFDQDIWDFLWMLPLLPYVARSLTIHSTKLDRHMGNLSFPLYLVHFPIISAAAIVAPGSASAKVAAAAIATLVAIATYLLVDRPIDRWRVRVTERAPTTA